MSELDQDLQSIQEARALAVQAGRGPAPVFARPRKPRWTVFVQQW